MTVADAKAALRRRMQAWRDGLSTADRATAAEAVASAVVHLVGIRPPAIVAGYQAIGAELDPEPALSALAARGWTLALPVMRGRTAPLQFRQWTPATPMVTRAWGIQEPTPEAPEVTPTVLLMPLLAFDAMGRRLGYGGGYYDRTLAARAVAGHPPLTIGLAYDGQCIDAVPTLDYDQPLDHILTPTRRFDRRPP